MDTNILYKKWQTKLLDMEYVHQYFWDEINIYNRFLQKGCVLQGDIKTLATEFDVGIETFYGFLLSIAKFLKNTDMQNLTNETFLDIKIDVSSLKEYLSKKESFSHLLNLFE